MLLGISVAFGVVVVIWTYSLRKDCNTIFVNETNGLPKEYERKFMGAPSMYKDLREFILVLNLIAVLHTQDIV